MSAIGRPRVFTTQGNTLDSPGERAAVKRSVGNLSLVTPSTKLDREQGQRTPLRLPLQLNQPAPNFLLCESHRSRSQFRGEV